MDEVIARSFCATLFSWEGKEFNLSSVLSLFFHSLQQESSRSLVWESFVRGWRRRKRRRQNEVTGEGNGDLLLDGEKTLKFGGNS